MKVRSVLMGGEENTFLFELASEKMSKLQSARLTLLWHLLIRVLLFTGRLELILDSIPMICGVAQPFKYATTIYIAQ